MKKKLRIVVAVVIDDMHDLDDMGLSPDQVAKVVLRTAAIRWPDATDKAQAVKDLIDALYNVRASFSDEDAGVDLEEMVADLDLKPMTLVNLAGVQWGRSKDGYWRPEDGSQAEGAQYPFDDDGLIAWFKLQPAQS